MANNYVIFDNNGLLADSELNPISKGNNKVDDFYIAFNDYDYTTTYVSVATTLPNGNSLPELGTSISDFSFKGTDYRGYKFEVPEPLTSIAGTLTITFYLKNKEDDRRLCSAQLNVPIHDSDVAVEPSIDQAQYDSLLIAIDNTAKELDGKKLDKNFLNYQNINNPVGVEMVALYTPEGETKRIEVENLHNIHEINGVAPIDRKVTLTANDIGYEETTIGDALKDLTTNVNDKANAEEAVYYRNGNLETIVDIRPTGVLNHATDTYVSEYDFARVILSDTDFEDGDIITCDVDLEAVTDSGNSFSNFSFTRVLKTGADTIDYNLVIPDGFGNFEKVILRGGISNNILAFRIISPTAVIYKPTIAYSMVRRG